MGRAFRAPSDSLSLKWGGARQIRVFKADTIMVAILGGKPKGREATYSSSG